MSARPQPTRPGLTLLELLLALALLGALTLAAVEWTLTAAHVQRDRAARAAWIGPARRALELIERDVRVGDAARRVRRENLLATPTGRVGVEADATGRTRLVIETRIDDRGPVERVYALDGGALRAAVRAPDGDAPLEATLLGGIETFDATLDREHRRLTVRLAWQGGDLALTRAIALEALE